MECLPVSKIPEGTQWTYEIKLDGYRLEVVKDKREITLYSRRRNILNRKFGYIAEALDDLPDGTILEGELVALNAEGHADFNLLQNFKSAEHYYAFDVLMHKGMSLIDHPLSERRAVLVKILPRNNHIGHTRALGGTKRIAGQPPGGEDHKTVFATVA
jgi:ATP-dependent DNA ligase